MAGFGRSACTPAVDDTLGNVHQPGVAGLGKFAEQFERADGVHPEALHDDALRLTDDVSGGEGGLQLFTLTAGQNRRGGVGRAADEARPGARKASSLPLKEIADGCT